MSTTQSFIDRWIDARTARRLRATLAEVPYYDASADTPMLAVPFPAGLGLVYRVPLEPSLKQIRVGATTIASRPGRGVNRLYVVDPYPLAKFAKPLAVAFTSGWRAFAFALLPFAWPETLLITRQAPCVDGTSLPLLDAATLQKWTVDGNTVLAQERQEPPIVADQLPPLSGPFPGEDLPEPPRGDDFPQPTDIPAGTPLNPLDPGPMAASPPCDPTLLFYALVFNGDEENSGQLSKGVTDAMAKRGYDAKMSIAGKEAPDGTKDPTTFEQMISGLEREIATKAKFCQCPTDQLIIMVSAHGENGLYGFIGYCGHETLNENIFMTDFFDRLAKVPAIASHPEKLVLILSFCNSGAVWSGAVPKSLKGMHLITSTTDPRDVSYGIVDSWLAQLLTEAGGHKIRTWTDLVRGLKWYRANRPQDAEDPRSEQPPIANGNVCDCAAKVWLHRVRYQGDDVGPLDSFVRVNHRGWIPLGDKPRTNNHGDSESGMLSLLLPKGVIACCNKAVKVLVEIDGASNDFHYISNTHAHVNKILDFVCDGTSQSKEVELDVPDRFQQQHGKLLFDIEFQSEC